MDKPNYELRRQLLIFTKIYSRPVIAQVLGIPLTWVINADLDSQLLKNRQLKKILSELEITKAYKDNLIKLKTYQGVHDDN